MENLKIPAKRLIAFSLTALMLLSVLMSCSTGSGNSKETSGLADTADTSAQETTQLYPDLPAQDFGGYEFKFLTRTLAAAYADWIEWDHRDIYAESISGDVINDAVFARNTKIEDKYNITISENSLQDFSGTVTKMVSAGDDSYDVVSPHISEFPALAQKGPFVDLLSVPNIDLEKPWWDQGCLRDLSVLHKAFVMEGDLLILDNDAMEVMIFNKGMLVSNNLENPYDIVNSGEWTFDKLIEMSQAVSKDINGDGKMYIQDDEFGCILQADSTPSFIVSGGDKLCSKDPDTDAPVITFGSDRSYRITDLINKMLADNDHFVHLHRYENKFPIYDEQVKMFSENRALFSWIRMRIVERLRGMETDFGIIPLPKLDAAQPNYITNNNGPTGAGVAIPVTASDLERTGMILEDLSAESRYTLQPAYYEINLRGKFARDDESQDMLDIILSNTAFDIGYIYDFGGFGGFVVNTGRSDKIPDFASNLEKKSKGMQAAIDKTTAAYEALS
ncbi:MAG: hypothetical protein ACYCWE_03660 [Eubacteriales bacterium]